MAQIFTNNLNITSQNRPLLMGTLVRLRWFAIVGQTFAVLFVAIGLNYSLPLNQCLMLIGVSTLFNVALLLKFGISHRPATSLAATQLAFDSLQLAGLLWLTGGLENPFSLLLLAPISVSAAILPQRETALLGALAVVIVTILSRTHLPLPWIPDTTISIPELYILGIWVALICGIVFVTIYANRVAHEARQLGDALTATELALSRQQHLSALDGLAAAAAHELGTPLATITLAAKEMLMDINEDGPIADDVRLIVEQAARCRSILSRLRDLDSENNSPFVAVKVSELIDEIIRPFAHSTIEIQVKLEGNIADEPTIVRNAGLLYGLGNLIENAVQFAKTQVVISAIWTNDSLCIKIEDDGPGFASELLPRMGEPYLKNTAPGRTDVRSSETVGLGLGVFIAKTLLSRTSASLEFTNKTASSNAIVSLIWPRSALLVELATVRS